MRPVFLYGTLRHAPLRAVVLGAAAAVRPATLPGHAVRHAGQASYPTIVEDTGACDGLIVEATDDMLARMDYYEGAFGYDRRVARADDTGQGVEVDVYWPDSPAEAGAPWDLAAWAAQLGPLATETATEAMWGFGRLSPADLAANFTMMGRRADARLKRAAATTPAEIRADLTRDDVVIDDSDRRLSFFSFEQHDLRYRQFDGAMGPRVRRAGLGVGESAIVLPYDPVRDRVMLVEQFRYAPFVLGDPRPWCLEPIAGLVDPGETAEETARREAVEEGNITLGRLETVARAYPSPGTLAEYQNIFVGLADLPDRAEGFGGLAAEHEDIRIHVIDYATLERLVETGEAEVGPLLLAAMWLKLHRARLRSG